MNGTLAPGCGADTRQGTVALASTSMDARDLDALADLVGAGGVVALSGAGLSTGSGTLYRAMQKCCSGPVQHLR